MFVHLTVSIKFLIQLRWWWSLISVTNRNVAVCSSSEKQVKCFSAMKQTFVAQFIYESDWIFTGADVYTKLCDKLSISCCANHEEEGQILMLQSQVIYYRSCCLWTLIRWRPCWNSLSNEKLNDFFFNTKLQSADFPMTLLNLNWSKVYVFNSFYMKTSYCEISGAFILTDFQFEISDLI